MVDLEIIKKNGRYLEGQYVRYVDEFQKDQMIAILENSAIGVIIDRSQATPPIDFAFNKYDKINLLGISKLPRCSHHYLIKHKNGIKIINPVSKKWYELCFEM
jgi:hypothetical protein